jgi:transposase
MDRLPHQDELVILGVDTHADIHVAAALDGRGRLLDTLELTATRDGFRALIRWATEFGVIDRIGVEGTGSYGAGLARWLRHEGLVVIVSRVRNLAQFGGRESWGSRRGRPRSGGASRAPRAGGWC